MEDRSAESEDHRAAPADAVVGTARGRSRVVGRAERLGLSADGPRPDNLNERALALPAETEPGTKFQYGPSHFYAFSEVLQRKLQHSGRPEKTTLEYLRKRVLEPVGIQVARIGRDRAGNPNLPGGMLLTAREWAKFGQFVSDGGSVRQSDGERKNLLRPDLLEQCFVPSATNPSYGLTWWLRSADAEADVGGLRGRVLRQTLQNQPVPGPDGKPLTVRMAAGLGKQRLYVIPQYQLVVVRFAEATTQGQRFDDRELVGRIVGSVR